MIASIIDRTRETANDRFKRSFGGWFWGGVMLAAVLHFALLEYFPKLTAADLGPDVPGPIKLVPPPDIDIPPPPDVIRRPQVPVPAEVDLDEDVTIHKTTFVDNPVKNLAPPPVVRAVEGKVFVRYTVSPELKNPSEALRIVEREYPPLLKAAGIGGSVSVLAHIDTLGRVLEVETAASSGNEALDQAALEAARLFRYTPALNMDRKVSVWVLQKIVFEVN
jgi:protein TonB